MEQGMAGRRPFNAQAGAHLLTWPRQLEQVEEAAALALETLYFIGYLAGTAVSIFVAMADTFSLMLHIKTEFISTRC